MHVEEYHMHKCLHNNKLSGVKQLQKLQGPFSTIYQVMWTIPSWYTVEQLVLYYEIFIHAVIIWMEY